MDVPKFDNVGTVGSVGDCKDKIVERSLSKNSNRAIGYLIPEASLAFTKLRKVFTKTLILWHLNPECHI